MKALLERLATASPGSTSVALHPNDHNGLRGSTLEVTVHTDEGPVTDAVRTVVGDDAPRFQSTEYEQY